MIKIYRYKGDYSAMVPDLPGCVAVAESVESVRRLMAEAVSLHIDMMRRSGEAIPKPTEHFEFTIDKDSEEEFCTWVNVKPLKTSTTTKKRRAAKQRPSRKQMTS